MSTVETVKRQHKFTIMLSHEEDRQLRALAKANRLCASALVRLMIIQHPMVKNLEQPTRIG
jgi:hypothetical protein